MRACIYPAISWTIVKRTPHRACPQRPHRHLMDTHHAGSMNPSDTETSCSTSSSSSVGPGEYVTPNQPTHQREDQPHLSKSIERSRDAGALPSYLRETTTDSGGKSRFDDALVCVRYGRLGEVVWQTTAVVRKPKQGLSLYLRDWRVVDSVRTTPEYWITRVERRAHSRVANDSINSIYR